MMREDSAKALCYIGKAPCGCYLYAAVNDGEDKKGLARDIARMVRAGWTIETKTVQWVRDGGLNFNCPHRGKNKTK